MLAFIRALLILALAATNRRVSILLPFSIAPGGDGTPESMAAEKIDSLVTGIARSIAP